MKRWFVAIMCALLIFSPALLFLPAAQVEAQETSVSSAAATDNLTWVTTPSATLDPSNLPLGNGNFSSTTPRVGYLLACNPAQTYTIKQTGANKIGDWLHGQTWNLVQKISEGAYIHGSVTRTNAVFNVTVASGTRTITTNDLPQGEPTGVFPVQSDDPGYPFDHNPNWLESQKYSISVPADPVVSATPSCVPFGPVGIGLDGVVFFSSIDSNGRDEPAYELQDSCGGMSSPEPAGIYHRYLPSLCIPNITKPNVLVGYALDGFGIFSPYDTNGRELTTKDLDVCHGTTTPIMWDGRMVTKYHYVLTRDFPYNVSCFRGASPVYIQMPPPPPMGFAGMAYVFWYRWQPYIIGVLVGAALFVLVGGLLLLRRRNRRSLSPTSNTF